MEYIGKNIYISQFFENISTENHSKLVKYLLIIGINFAEEIRTKNTF